MSHSRVLVLVVVDAAGGAGDQGVARGEVGEDEGGHERHGRPRNHLVQELKAIDLAWNNTEIIVTLNFR